MPADPARDHSGDCDSDQRREGDEPGSQRVTTPSHNRDTTGAFVVVGLNGILQASLREAGAPGTILKAANRNLRADQCQINALCASHAFMAAVLSLRSWNRPE
jgi:hypothetical protein